MLQREGLTVCRVKKPHLADPGWDSISLGQGREEGQALYRSRKALAQVPSRA